MFVERYGEDKTVTAAGDFCMGPRVLPGSKSNKMRIEGGFGPRNLGYRIRLVAYLERIESQNNLYDWRIEEVEVHKVLISHNKRHPVCSRINIDFAPNLTSAVADLDSECSLLQSHSHRMGLESWA